MLERLKLPISKGLEIDADLVYNLEYLNDCQNLYLNANGVFEAETFTKTAFGLADNLSAQVFVTRAGIFVLTLQSDSTTDTLYEWNGSSLITRVSSIPSSYRAKLWSCADFGVYLLFSNGESTLVRTTSTGEFTLNNTVIPASNWICSHRGRIILTDPVMTTKGITSEALVSYYVSADTIHIHNAKTGADISNFAAPDTDLSGMTVANGNLITCDYNTDKIYIHSLITSTESSSFASPGALPYGVAFDGTNLISCDATVGNQKIYIHNGIAAGTTSSFAVPYAEIGVRGIYDICVIQGNLISCDTASTGNAKIYVHDGISATISSSFEVSGKSLIPGITTDGVNIIYDAGGGEIRFCSGTTSTVTKIVNLADGGATTGSIEYVRPGYPRFVEWSRINALTFQNTTTADETNESGYMPMEYTGNLLRSEPLKNHIIVYGENGVSALTLAGTRGYGMTTLHHLGIKDAGAVCSNGTEDGATAHYFIDTSGELYVIDANLQKTRIGYKDILSTAHTANAGLIRMSYNTRRDEVLINFYNSDKTYVFGRYGLTYINGDIESMCEEGGTRYVHALTTIAQDDVLFISNIIDMGCECQKYFRGFYANIASPDTVSVRVNYRTTRTGSWTTPSYATFDKAAGFFNTGMIAGIEFRIEIYVASYTAFQVSDIEVVYSKIGGARSFSSKQDRRR